MCVGSDTKGSQPLQMDTVDETGKSEEGAVGGAVGGDTSWSDDESPQRPKKKCFRVSCSHKPLQRTIIYMVEFHS